MPDSPRRIIRLTNLLSIIIALMISLAVPSVYFALSYQYHAAALSTEAHINAEITTQFVSQHPEHWMFMEERLISLLDLKSVPFREHRRRILDAAHEEIVSNETVLPAPLLVRTSPFYDAGHPIGVIEITQTLRPLALNTLYVFLFSALTAGAFLFSIRFLPLRALREALGRLEESRMLLESVFRSFHDAVLILRADTGHLIGCNPATENLFGCPLAEFLLMEPGRLREYVRLEPVSGEPNQDSEIGRLMTVEMKRRTGDTFPAEYSRAFFRDRNGNLVSVVVVRDITERKLQEERILNINRELEFRVEARTKDLSDREKRLRYLFKRSPTPVLILAAPTARILDANDAALQLLECSHKDCMERNLSSFIVPESDIQFQSLVASPGDRAHLEYISEAELITRLGNPRVVSIHVRRLTLGGEAIIFCSIFDVTETVHLRAQWRMSLQKLVQAEKMEFLGTMVSGFAHDINNPNQLIRTNVQVLSEIWRDVLELLEGYGLEDHPVSLGGLSYEQARESVPLALKDVEAGSNRISRIIQNLMGYAREHHVTIVGNVNVNRIVEEAVMLLKHRIRQMTDHFRMDLDDQVPMIKGNAQSLEQAVINLVVNALEALPDPSHYVAVETRYVPEQRTILIRVEDSGSGMAPDILEQSRKPFFTTKEKSGGSGLGLSITQMLIQEHGGSLGIQSTPGSGTTITVTLPAS